MRDLTDLGFGPFFERQLQPAADAGIVLARVAAEHRGAYEVWGEAGEGSAQLAGRLRQEPGETGFPGVGDWVVLDGPPGPERTAVVERVLARRTVFTRGAPGREARLQIIAANVDLVFVVSGLDEDYNVRRIERYVARVWASGAQPTVILNKADLCADATARGAEVEGRCAGVPILVTSARSAMGVEEVRALLRPGTTVALVGSSGAGKSTLVNALLGEERMATSAVRARDGRGRHATTHRQLVLLPGGGLLVDTPGMRELQLGDDEGLDAVFEDVAALAAGCRFGDCLHDGEPGCAVLAAVASGALSPDRLEHYRKLASEAQAFERRHDAGLRRREGRRWGQLHDEVARLRDWKGGKP